MIKIIRTSTVPISLNILLKGQLKFLAQYFEIVAISSSGNDLSEVETREKVPVHAIEIERKISLFRDIVSLVKLYRFLRKEKPTIIHSITPKAGLLSMIAGKMAGVPVRIHTFTGLIFPSKQGVMQKILIIMDRVLCKCATHIYPEGEGVRRDLVTSKITSKPLKILANGNVNGIDLIYFDPQIMTDERKTLLRMELKVEPEDFVFVFVGRLVGDKGINELINAFLKIKSLNTKLLLVGSFEVDLDPLNSVIMDQISSNRNIITVGFQEDVRPYLAISNALVFPSYREGFPNVVMQAGAMGLPSIVSNINGCNEIIIEDKNGTIIPVKDVNALHEAMQKFVGDKAHLSKLKNNARQMIEKRYEQSMVWNAILNEYNVLLAENNV